jgi:hypothetical protein
MEEEKWEKIGVIGVDAGLCWIGDPCYIMHKDEPPKAIGKNWPDFCSKIDRKKNPTAQQFDYDMGHAGLGVLTDTGYGDGCYDVFAQMSDEGDWGKRIKAVKVVFIEDE